LRLNVPDRLGGMAISPESLESLAISRCVREVVFRERGEYVKLCTLTGHSGQDESRRVIESLLYLIGRISGKLCPHVVLINFDTPAIIGTRRSRVDIRLIPIHRNRLEREMDEWFAPTSASAPGSKSTRSTASSTISSAYRANGWNPLRLSKKNPTALVGFWIASVDQRVQRSSVRYACGSYVMASA